MFFIGALVTGLITIGEVKVLFRGVPLVPPLSSTLDPPDILKSGFENINIFVWEGLV